MMWKIQKAIRKILLKVLKLTQPSPLQNYLRIGAKYFEDSYLDPTFDTKPFKGKWNPYFLKYGVKEPILESAYFSAKSGIESDLYFSRGLAFNLIYPYLARTLHIPAYADKNLEARLLNIKKMEQLVDVRLPKVVLCNMNGVFFDSEDNEIVKSAAVKLVQECTEAVIVKPTIGTYGGQGVRKINNPTELEDENVEHLFGLYESDFVIQKCVTQHPELAKFNESSVNTIRVVTYRTPRKDRKVLYTLIRFGAKGAINDNASGGGAFCVIDKNTGLLRDRRKFVYRKKETLYVDNAIPDRIPYFDKIIKAALALHGQMPHFDICGWDFTVTPDGHPVLIEYNIRPGHGLQEGTGPMFERSDLDEIMEKISKRNEEYYLGGRISFPGKRDFDFR